MVAQEPGVVAGPEVDADVRVRAAVARARGAQAEWGALSPRERARRMRPVRALLVRLLDEVVDAIHRDTGKPRTEALTEAIITANLLRTLERRAPRVLRPRRVGSGAIVSKRGRKTYEPYGVVGVISPWNYPFLLPAIPVFDALFAGNAVVLKPSEVTPAAGRLLGALVREGVPGHPHLLEVVEGEGAVGAALVRSGVDKVAFIGSTEAGRRVAVAAAERLVPVVLELGANDVAIVCEDADVERAAAGIVWGAVANAGQVCISVERVLVAEPVYERFLSAAAEEIRRLRVGAEGEGEVSRLIHPPQLRVVEEAVRDAVGKGARVVEGGRVLDPEGPVYAPTLLAGVGEDAALHRRETFGPVLPVTPVRSEEEAVRIANAGPFGLNASVWTGSASRARRIAGRLRAGAVTVNDALITFGMAELPYGGVGESGFGRLLGDEGLLEFSRTRSLVEPRFLLRRELYWFPYGEEKYRLLARLARLALGVGWRGRLGR